VESVKRVGDISMVITVI